MLDLADYLRGHRLDAVIVEPGAHMSTVEAAAGAMGCSPDQIFKSILFVARDGRCAMAIARSSGQLPWPLPYQSTLRVRYMIVPSTTNTPIEPIRSA